jgi:hypothetical protein
VHMFIKMSVHALYCVILKRGNSKVLSYYIEVFDCYVKFFLVDLVLVNEKHYTISTRRLDFEFGPS